MGFQMMEYSLLPFPRSQHHYFQMYVVKLCVCARMRACACMCASLYPSWLCCAFVVTAHKCTWDGEAWAATLYLNYRNTLKKVWWRSDQFLWTYSMLYFMVFYNWRITKY